MFVYIDTTISKKSKKRIWGIMKDYIYLRRFKEPRMCIISMHLNNKFRGYRGCQIGYDKLLKNSIKVTNFVPLTMENGVMKYDNTSRLVFKIVKHETTYKIYSIFNTNGLLIKPSIKIGLLPKIYDNQPRASM